MEDRFFPGNNWQPDRSLGPRVIDLALGRNVGVELLESLHTGDIRFVIPADSTVENVARERGFSVHSEFSKGDVLFSIHWPQIVPPQILSLPPPN